MILARRRVRSGGWSNDCIWIKQLVHHAARVRPRPKFCHGGSGARRSGVGGCRRMPSRRATLPIASISSMKPIAPPSLRAAFRSALKNERIAIAGHPLPHRLERGRRDEQERHARLLGHRLREVGLAGPGRALEQDAAPRRAAELVAERRVAQEHVEGADHLVDLAVEPLDVGEARSRPVRDGR